MALLRGVQHLAWPPAGSTFLEAVQHVDAAHRVAILVIGGVVAGVGAVIIPSAIGGHGGEMETIWFAEARFPFVRTLARATLSIVAVALGASLGREGAPSEAGAAFAALISRPLRLSAAQRRLLAACGSGAGLAAVYNVPLGGALFVLEVLLGSVTLPLVIVAFATATIATATAWITLANRPTYDVAQYPFSWQVDDLRADRRSACRSRRGTLRAARRVGRVASTARPGADRRADRRVRGARRARDSVPAAARERQERRRARIRRTDRTVARARVAAAQAAHDRGVSRQRCAGRSLHADADDRRAARRAARRTGRARVARHLRRRGRDRRERRAARGRRRKARCRHWCSSPSLRATPKGCSCRWRSP